MKIRSEVDWCTKIPLDTPLVCLVTVDPAIGVIEHHIPQGMNRLVVRSKTYESRRLARVRFFAHREQTDQGGEGGIAAWLSEIQQKQLLIVH